jgi:hypothetical protein
MVGSDGVCSARIQWQSDIGGRIVIVVIIIIVVVVFLTISMHIDRL